MVPTYLQAEINVFGPSSGPGECDMTVTQETRTRPLSLPADEAMDQLQSGEPCLVLDVRAPEDWKGCCLKIQGALRIPPDQVQLDPSWPKDRFTLVYCDCPSDKTSVEVAKKLCDMGFENVNVLRGGFRCWQEKAGPVEPKSVDQSDPRTAPA
jgi:rhodanese-related sulfurtransferase